MLKAFSQYGGLAQTAIGLLSQFAPGVGSALGAQAAGGNVFNMLSGASLSYLGFKCPENNQRMGALGIGGLNAVVGLLGTFGINNLFGIQLNEGMVSNVINLAIGAWGLFAGLSKKKA